MAALSPTIDEYLESCRAQRQAKGTVINKRVVLQQLLADIGNLQVHNIDGGHIDAWLTKRSYKAPSTRNRDVDIVRDFFKWCRARRITKPDHDPLVGVRRAMALPRERIFLQPTQFGELLDAADSGRDRITIAIGLYTFLRTSEITRLRIQHVHIEDPNPKKWRLQVWKPKTGDYDELPVSKPLERELRRWLLDYRGQMGRDLHKDWYLVPAFHKQYFQPGGKGRLPMKTINPERPFKRAEMAVQRALKALGYSDTHLEGIHTLRRSGGLALYETLLHQGHDGAGRIVQSMYGHRSFQTTESYLRIGLEKKRRDELIAGEDPFDTQPEAEVIQLAAKAD